MAFRAKPKKVSIQSLVDSHEEPFMAIDESFTIVAVNSIFERIYRSEATQTIGRHCYEVSHGNSRPCFELGEECPFYQVNMTRKPYSCLHIHNDGERGRHRVRVTGYPLTGMDGERYVGETIIELTNQDVDADTRVSMVGASAPFLDMVEKLVVAAESDAPILLLGETGTGKELAASFLHQQSPRCDKPFFTLDCTTLSESLFENEIFGHERGAFTGSIGATIGLFEQANGGTLFLDEMGELPATIQAKLLRVLDTGEFRRVGDTRTRYADVRIVCATNRNLEDEVREKRFRQDLYYRIACMKVQLPSLRQRLTDIPVLASKLLRDIGQSNKYELHLTESAMKRLEQYDYPGNVRELKNILTAAAALRTGNWLDLPQLQSVMAANEIPAPQNQTETSTSQNESLVLPHSDSIQTQSLSGMERQMITLLLQKYAGCRKKVADKLGISVRTLYRKLKKYGLK